MVIEQYGVTLRRLTRDKIELVRTWRNDPKISQHMAFRDHITPEMQERWFDTIDNDRNYYFLMVWQGEEVGLAQIKAIEHHRGEIGIFIYHDSARGQKLSYRTYRSLIDFGFDTLGLERITAHIRQGNEISQKLHTKLGFVALPDQEQIDNQLYFLVKEQYVHLSL